MVVWHPKTCACISASRSKESPSSEPLEMQPSGLITNWPRDFFGDMLAERMALGGFYPKSEDRTADG